MMLRRVARLVLFAFVLGPASNLECLISCAPAEVAASAGECHGTANQHPTFDDEQSCSDALVQLAPFVKPAGLQVLALAVPISHAGQFFVSAIEKPFPVRASGSGPSGRHAVVPLRI
jgi:hypothetical protein